MLGRQQEQRAEMRDAHAQGERAAHRLVQQTLPVRTANENVAPRRTGADRSPPTPTASPR